MGRVSQLWHGHVLRRFLLSGYPHLEEAYWFGEGVIPEPSARGLLDRMAAPVAGGAAPLPVSGGR